VKYVNVSGGADSTAMALLLWERGEDFEMVFSDTGAELPEVYWLLPRLAQVIGKKLNVVSTGSFFQHLVQYGYMIPSVQVRWCTGVLKRAPLDRYSKSVNADSVCIGIRADEPQRLNHKNRGGINFIYPLADTGLEKKDAKKLCAKYDLLNPVYEWRSSVSCFCCFFQRISDWRGLQKNHPTLYAIAEEWERQSMHTSERGYTWCKGHFLENIRKADERQLKFWPEPDGEPCLICTV